jgi:hypothetical protein
MDFVCIPDPSLLDAGEYTAAAAIAELIDNSIEYTFDFNSLNAERVISVQNDGAAKVSLKFGIQCFTFIGGGSLGSRQRLWNG